MRHVLFLIPLLLASTPAQSAEFLPGEVIVRWRTAPAREALTKEASAVVPGIALRVRRAWGQVEVLRLRGATRAQTLTLAARLHRRSDVVYAQPNYIRRPFRVPNDEHYPIQWALPRAKLPTAWDITTGSSSIVVAVVDTGVRPAHPDLAGRLLPGYDFISTQTLSGDGDGRDADPTDVGDSDPAGSSQHGTHVAGIIGATSNNSQGVSGVDWACKILPVRALGVDEGRGSDGDISAAIRWAAGLKIDGVPDNPTPAHIINLSFGGEGRSDLLADAVRAAVGQGAIVVTAAGNDGQDAANIFPGALPDVLNVGAIGYDGNRAGYSNFGDVLTLVAPGGDLLANLDIEHQGQTYVAGIVAPLFNTTTQKFGYHMYEGTSQAAPLVAGVAALVLAANPALDAAEVRRLLANTADPTGRCAEGCGAGLVDAHAAVESAVALLPPPPPPPGEGLPFGAPCTEHDECADKTCRNVTAGLICTVNCTEGQTTCPGESECLRGYCDPGRAPTTNTPIGGPELLGGCHAGPPPNRSLPSSAGVLSLLFVLALIWRLRRR